MGLAMLHIWVLLIHRAGVTAIQEERVTMKRQLHKAGRTGSVWLEEDDDDKSKNMASVLAHNKYSQKQSVQAAE